MKTKYILLIFIFILTFLYYFSEIDIFISSKFFDSLSNTFYLKNYFLFSTLYDSVYIIAPSLFVIGILNILYQWLFKKTFKILNIKATIYIFLVFIIGSGLIVNVLLKDNFGRARPSKVTYFGGQNQFTPPAIITNQCDKNCSFTCGHCSFAFGFIAFYYLYRRKVLLYFALSYGFLVSLTRVAQGGHFLSDAISSFFIMLITANFLYELMYKNDKN